MAGTGSPAIICVQFYEFNSASPVVLSASGLLNIQGWKGEQGPSPQSVDARTNFTITQSVDQLVLGGPANANEGTDVAFAITAIPGASGTYNFGLRGFQLGSEPLMCGPNGVLVAGNGQPNYTLSGAIQMCITVTTTSSGFNVPGVGYSVPSDNLFYRITYLSNSTT
jgi:hypothetical protein